METSPTIAELATALAKAQGEIENAERTRQSGQSKSRYATLASVRESIRGPLAKNGLSVYQTPVDAERGVIRLCTRLMHQSGEYIQSYLEFPVPEVAGGNPAQRYGSGLTYACRYALCAALGTAPEDDDGDSAGPQRAPESRGDRAAVETQPGKAVTTAAVERARAGSSPEVKGSCDAQAGPTGTPSKTRKSIWEGSGSGVELHPADETDKARGIFWATWKGHVGAVSDEVRYTILNGLLKPKKAITSQKDWAAAAWGRAAFAVHTHAQECQGPLCPLVGQARALVAWKTFAGGLGFDPHDEAYREQEWANQSGGVPVADLDASGWHALAERLETAIAPEEVDPFIDDAGAVPAGAGA